MYDLTGKLRSLEASQSLRLPPSLPGPRPLRLSPQAPGEIMAGLQTCCGREAFLPVSSRGLKCQQVCGLSVGGQAGAGPGQGAAGAPPRDISQPSRPFQLPRRTP